MRVESVSDPLDTNYIIVNIKKNHYNNHNNNRLHEAGARLIDLSFIDKKSVSTLISADIKTFFSQNQQSRKDVSLFLYFIFIKLVVSLNHIKSINLVVCSCVFFIFTDIYHNVYG